MKDNDAIVTKLGELMIATNNVMINLPGYDRIPPSDESLYNLVWQYTIFQIPKHRGLSAQAVLTGFDNLEDMASWEVLRQISSCKNPDRCIANYSRQERLTKFRDALYTNPEDFDIFEAREKAINFLDNFGVLEKKVYVA